MTAAPTVARSHASEVLASDDLTTAIGALDAGHGVLVAGVRGPGTGTFPVEDPATGEVLAHVADGSVADATAAVTAAHDAFSGWSRTPPRQRSEILRRSYELLVRDVDRLAALISAENGKSLTDARGEVRYSADFFRWYAEEAVRPHGDFGAAPAGDTRTVVTHRPVGVAALVTPWNFPAAMAARKIAPALAAGCTVVLKPARETPLAALAIAGLLEEAGVPAGVVNLVPTSSAGQLVSTWLGDDRVRKLSFTGSTEVGRVLLKQAAARVVNTSMELGGNAPFVVLPGADVEAAVAGAVVAKFRGGGQACTAANRFYVHASVADYFTAGLCRAVKALTVGPAFTGAQIGPLINARELSAMRRLVAAAVEQGAKVAARAVVPPGLTGHFLAPAVLTGVAPDAEVLRAEIFGPVAPVVVYDDDWSEQTLLAAVNSTEMGLAAYVYGELHQALHIAEQIEAGMVGINRGLVSDPSAPFGGMKQSGLGREGARAGIEEYLETQYLSVAW